MQKTKIDREQIIAAVKRGDRYESIAFEFSCSVSSITKIVSSHPELRRHPTSSDLRSLIQRVETLAAKGMKPAAIAKKVGRTRSTVYQYLYHARLRERERGQNRDRRNEPAEPIQKIRRPTHCGFEMIPCYENWPGHRPIWSCAACDHREPRHGEPDPLVLDDGIDRLAKSARDFSPVG